MNAQSLYSLAVSALGSSAQKRLGLDDALKDGQKFLEVQTKEDSNQRLTLADYIRKEKSIYNKYEQEYQHLVDHTGGKTDLEK